MPLPSLLPEPDLDAAKALRNRARDMEMHQEQMIPRLVQGTDGWLYLAAAGLETEQADVEPFPLLTPQSRAGTDPDTAALMEEAGRITRRTAARFDDYGHQIATPLLDDSGNLQEDGRGPLVLFRGNRAAVRPNYPLQVIGLGRGRWFIAPGQISETHKFTSWPSPLAAQQLNTFPGKTLTCRDRGFLVVRIHWKQNPVAAGWTYQFLGAENVAVTQDLKSSPPRSGAGGFVLAEEEGFFYLCLAAIRDGRIAGRWAPTYAATPIPGHFPGLCPNSTWPLM